MFARAAIPPTRANAPYALRTVWRTHVSDGGVPPQGVPAGDRLHWFGVAGQVTALNAAGKVAWRQPIQTVPRSLLLASGNVIAVEARVTAWNEATGREAWRFKPSSDASLGEATVARGRLYFGDRSGSVYALRAADGRLLWHVSIRGASGPRLVAGVAVAGDRLYAAGEESLGPTSARAWLCALDALTGATIWRASVGAAGERRGFGAAPSVTRGLVLAADTLGNSIVAFDRRDRERWVFRGKHGSAGFPEPPLVRNGVVLAGSGDGFVYALRLADGRPVWRRRLGGSVLDFALCGRVLLVNDTELMALDPASGRLLGSLFTSGVDFPSSGIAVHGRRALVLGPRGAYEVACR
ncbi:MAG TPA: PQQ-binding-like beta-propeller repeat protein [Terriglobales bacterium]|nr:PQQ-binding-like beta-propeller repeat protein [Terriglobales bacterium]